MLNSLVWHGNAPISLRLGISAEKTYVVVKQELGEEDWTVKTECHSSTFEGEMMRVDS